MNLSKIPGIKPGERHPNWGELYQKSDESRLPWFFPSLDPDVEAELMNRRKEIQRVLDLGTGLGTQAALIEQMGFQVTATDIAPAAIQKAQAKHPKVDFIVDDVTQTNLRGQFDCVVDRGCFHVLATKDYPSYVQAIKKILRPRGLFLLKVFSREVGALEKGPLCFSDRELVTLFADSFNALSLRRSVYHGSTPTPPPAIFMVARKREAA